MIAIAPPRRVQLEQPLQLAGIQTRTTNLNEATPEARIQPLWQRFFSERVAQSVPGYTPQSQLYGVYSGYASDAHGAYDLTAAVLAGEVPQGLVGIEVPVGDYLVFEAQGAMPQAVLAAWAAVWKYFEGAPAHPRRYAVDFEQYSGDGRVAVYIGVIAAD
ncbi:GyrI-like domain-containing protein [Rhodoferax sp.]|uniref:GyrI-like domain-containing protein n=1 Tax=Rhodoferax sp. TaxID=50421 RepID=UPI00374DC106